MHTPEASSTRPSRRSQRIVHSPPPPDVPETSRESALASEAEPVGVPSAIGRRSSVAQSLLLRLIGKLLHRVLSPLTLAGFVRQHVSTAHPPMRAHFVKGNSPLLQ